MEKMNISSDIVPVGEFKNSISKFLNRMRETGHHVVITQNGRPAGVLISPDEYDEMEYKKTFINSVKRGLDDINSGKSFSEGEMKRELGLDHPEDLEKCK